MRIKLFYLCTIGVNEIIFMRYKHVIETIKSDTSINFGKYIKKAEQSTSYSPCLIIFKYNNCDNNRQYMNVTKSLKNIRTSVGILLQKMQVSDCNDRKSTKKCFNFYSLNEYHSAPNQLSPDVSMTCTPSEYIITITSELFV